MLKYRAFTLIELLLSLFLLATILFFSIPFASSIHKKNQVQVIQDDIKGAIRFAKIEAYTKGNNVTLTPLQDSNDWSKGMLLFIDNPKHHYTQDDKVIHEWHWKSVGIHVAWRGFQSSHYLLFSADASQNDVNGSFFITSDAKYDVTLVINKLGRIK